MHFDMKLLLFLRDNIPLMTSYCQNNFLRIVNLFLSNYNKSIPIVINILIDMTSIMIQFGNYCRDKLNSCRDSILLCYETNRFIVNVVIPNSFLIIIILSSIVYIRFNDKRPSRGDFVVAITRHDSHSERDSRNRRAFDRTKNFAQKHDIKIPKIPEETTIARVLDPAKEARLRQQVSGSKVFVDNGFIDIVFDEKLLDLTPPIISQKTISRPQRPPTNKDKSKKGTADVAEIAIVSDKRRDEKPFVTESDGLQAASKTAPNPEINDLLSSYKIKEHEGGVQVIVPGGNLFARNSDELSRNASTILKPIADAAQLDDGLTLTIIGHTDSIKSVDASRELSLLRAKLVRDFLSKSFGIKADRMEVLGEGKGSPIASNSTLDGRQANRRVEILFRKI